MTRNTRKGQISDQSVESRMEDQAVESDNAANLDEAVEAFESVEPDNADAAVESDTTDLSDLTPEAMMAEIARLRAERDELSRKVAARPARVRVPKLTAKQLRFLRALHKSPESDLSDLVRESGAGGVTEPHGFVYRLIDAGYVRLVLPEATVTRFPDITAESVEADIRGESGEPDESNVGAATA